jgi:hypothetical protein
VKHESHGNFTNSNDLNLNFSLYLLKGNQQRASITVSHKNGAPLFSLFNDNKKKITLKYSRAGAENLYKATSNKKLKETINLELSFMNSTLQLLKEQLAELNSAVDVYQHEK